MSPVSILTPGILGLWTVYAIAALLTLSIAFRSTWSGWIKVFAIFLTTVLIANHFRTVPQLSGWPTAAQLPRNFRLLAATIEEPDKVRGTNGSIYLWTMSLDENPQPKPPRAHQVAYSVQLHDKINAALTKMRRGLPQMGHLQPTLKSSGELDNVSTRLPDLDFFDVPDPLFPDR